MNNEESSGYISALFRPTAGPDLTLDAALQHAVKAASRLSSEHNQMKASLKTFQGYREPVSLQNSFKAQCDLAEARATAVSEKMTEFNAMEESLEAEQRRRRSAEKRYMVTRQALQASEEARKKAEAARREAEAGEKAAKQALRLLWSEQVDASKKRFVAERRAELNAEADATEREALAADLHRIRETVLRRYHDSGLKVDSQLTEPATKARRTRPFPTSSAEDPDAPFRKRARHFIQDPGSQAHRYHQDAPNRSTPKSETQRGNAALYTRSYAQRSNLPSWD
ncbi:hypothetical protein DFH06DRAFT_104455 [Mycena polygramma]|nr:hypothetical protein DFH06DRAFT_104455 [Mycena polygramma]